MQYKNVFLLFLFLLLLFFLFLLLFCYFLLLLLFLLFCYFCYCYFSPQMVLSLAYWLLLTLLCFCYSKWKHYLNTEEDLKEENNYPGVLIKLLIWTLFIISNWWNLSWCLQWPGSIGNFWSKISEGARNISFTNQ